MATHYISGTNYSGYLPDVIPTESATFEEAKQALIAEILWEADHNTSDDVADALAALAEDVNLWSRPDSVTVADPCGDRAWWIYSADGEMSDSY
jgi:hypothetical protein